MLRFRLLTRYLDANFGETGIVRFFALEAASWASSFSARDRLAFERLVSSCRAVIAIISVAAVVSRIDKALIFPLLSPSLFLLPLLCLNEEPKTGILPLGGCFYAAVGITAML